MADPSIAELFIAGHIRLAAFQIQPADRFRGGQDLIGYSKIRLPGIITVLQGSTHKLHFILVPGDLCQEASARAHDSNSEHSKFLDRRVWEAGNGRRSVVRERLLIESQKVIHTGNGLSALSEPCGKYHVLFSLGNGLAVEYFYFDLVNSRIPPLRLLLIKTDS